MNKRYKILVFPGGTEIGLEINRALRYEKDIELYSCGMDIPAHSSYQFKNHFILPSIRESIWLEELNRIIDSYSITHIFPAHDDVIMALIQNNKYINAKIISSPIETCKITRSKSATYEKFRNILPVPHIYKTAKDIKEYPVFLKPDRGQGSQNCFKVSNEFELKIILNEYPEILIMEYLSGDEFTIDCFSDRDDGLLYCKGRKRNRIRNGISMNCTEFDEPIFSIFAKKINDLLKIHGAWFFQVKLDKDGNYKLLEIAPRIAGTMAYNRVKGINFALLSIFEQERIPVKILNNNVNVVLDRALISRYKHNINYNTIYVDFDDTIIIDNKINIFLIGFLFQQLNNRKKLILLTKCKVDVHQLLKKYRISELFDEVIHIQENEEKKNFINAANSIFIDDSFSERYRVQDALGIPTFDLSMIEMLIDDRI